MAEITGFNPDKVKREMQLFEDEGMKVYNSIVKANSEFMDGLSKSWWSQYAVEFGEKQTPNLLEAQEIVKLLINNTIVDTINAYNELAASNGEPTISDDHSEMEDFNPELVPNGTYGDLEDMLSVSPDGDVGMKLESVRQLLQTYENAIYQIIDVDIDAIPMNISFFDPGSALQLAYQQRVQEVKNKLDEKLKGVYAGVNAHLDDEMLLVEEGAEGAADAMGGGA